ncbi:UNVERIFIED_CONTAM: Retrovirus-related Pol polyprotein from transposon TNT 1-94 [Sesamum calycinum]|uniref:Retrovirus-related Pol polyprotein from transposon TNT 1-94 n=1 Tax=Sesamum calycinum TaxID=2727403 RepID=A0AAW2MBJ9_9LAMI
MAMSISKALPDLSKLEPLNGTNYKRWSQKLLIFFEQLDIDYMLFKTPPEPDVHTKTSSIALTPIAYERNWKCKGEIRQRQQKQKDRLQPKGKKFQKRGQQKTFKGNDVVVEANLMENKTDWILDTGTSKHFCSNKELFQDFQETRDGECVFMGNSTTAGVLGKGKIFLKLNSEEIYMEQPEGFAFPGQEDKVCKLKESLYGLKQALKQWSRSRVVEKLGGRYAHVGVINSSLHTL